MRINNYNELVNMLEKHCKDVLKAVKNISTLERLEKEYQEFKVLTNIFRQTKKREDYTESTDIEKIKLELNTLYAISDDMTKLVLTKEELASVWDILIGKEYEIILFYTERIVYLDEAYTRDSDHTNGIVKTYYIIKHLIKFFIKLFTFSSKCKIDRVENSSSTN